MFSSDYAGKAPTLVPIMSDKILDILLLLVLVTFHLVEADLVPPALPGAVLDAAPQEVQNWFWLDWLCCTLGRTVHLYCRLCTPSLPSRHLQTGSGLYTACIVRLALQMLCKLK